jgi:hypothetical protein
VTSSLALALALVVAGHTSSEGRSSFTLDESGRVKIRIEIGFPDVPELCATVNLFDGRARPLMDQKLEACLERTIPLEVKLRGDERPCPVVVDRHEIVDAPPSGTLAIEASADCQQLPRVLVIDWGLFTGSPLDHVSVARVAQPFGEQKLVMLSRRAPRASVEIAPSGHALVFGAAAALVVVVVVVVAVAVLVRARRKRASSVQ